MKKILLKFTPLFCLLFLFSCGKDKELIPSTAATEMIQARDSFRPCAEPCEQPDNANVSEVTGCSAVLTFGFDEEKCGTFSVQLRNLATGEVTNFNPVGFSMKLQDLDACTNYSVSVSHITDQCASAPLVVVFQTLCEYCREKSCDAPCYVPGLFYVDDISCTSAVAYFGFETGVCGYFILRLTNNETGEQTYYDPAVSPFTLTGLDPVTSYTLNVSYVTDVCASAPIEIEFVTEDGTCCDPLGVDPSCLYIQSLTYEAGGGSMIWADDPTVGYLDKTDETLYVGNGHNDGFLGFCFCLDLEGDVFIQMWVDYNENGHFETEELVNWMSADLSGNGNSSITCTNINLVSFNITEGACGLPARLILSHGQHGPCGHFAIGQVIDFTIDTITGC